MVDHEATTESFAKSSVTLYERVSVIYSDIMSATTNGRASLPK